jgi:hypothetical protein
MTEELDGNFTEPTDKHERKEPRSLEDMKQTTLVKPEVMERMTSVSIDGHEKNYSGDPGGHEKNLIDDRSMTMQIEAPVQTIAVVITGNDSISSDITRIAG